MDAEVNPSTTEPVTDPAEPALFEVVNRFAKAPVMVCCDHAGRRIPAPLGDLGVQAEAMETHIACDIGARQVSEELARRFQAPLLLANYSRLGIDLNRHLDDPTLIPEVSDGIAIPGNAGLPATQRRRRIEQWFRPYHQRYGEMVDHLQARFARPLIVSVHSFAPRLQGARRPWDFGVLWEHQRPVAESIIANLRRNPGLRIGSNQPYHARDPLGYAMVVHAQARGVNMALIEIRQDHITHRAGQRWAADILYRAIAPLLDHSLTAGHLAGQPR